MSNGRQEHAITIDLPMSIRRGAWAGSGSASQPAVRQTHGRVIRRTSHHCLRAAPGATAPATASAAASCRDG